MAAPWIRLLVFSTFVLVVPAACAAEDAAAVRWDVESFARVVQPLRQPLRGRLPMLAWNMPLPRGGALVKMREDGSLRRAIGVFAARGVLPTVDLGWDWTLEGALALAQTLQDAKQPVNIQLPRVDLVEGTAYADVTIWVEGPDASRGGQNRKWPCLAQSRPEKTAAWVCEQLRPFKDAGIRVAGVWFDDECLPHPWNGCWDAMRSTEECRRAFPPGVLDSFAAFRKSADPLKSELFTPTAKAIREMFPGALTGEYGDVFSGTDARFGLDAQMASLYANTRTLPGAFKGRPISQAEVDRFYFKGLLDGFSASAAKRAPGKINMPYVSQYTPDNADPKYAFPMGDKPYVELLRHFFLRGADTLYLFNLGYPGSPVTAEFSLKSVELARGVYDEMLGRREFLQKGTPATLAELAEDGTVWSGLHLRDRCLVRVTLLSGEPRTVPVTAFEGKTVELAVSGPGAWYLVRADGKAQRLPER